MIADVGGEGEEGRNKNSTWSGVNPVLQVVKRSCLRYCETLKNDGRAKK